VVIKTRLKKSIGIMLLFCFSFGTIMLYGLSNDKSVNKNIVFLFVSGMIILIAGLFLFKFIKAPIQYELTETELVLKYFNHKIVNISWGDIKCAALKIHSQKTALISLYYQENMNIGKLKTINIYKGNSYNFEQAYKKICSSVTKDCDIVILKMYDKLGRQCSEFTEPSINWYEFITKKKTISDTFKEIIEEGIVKKALLILGFIFLVLIKVTTHDKKFILDSFTCWMIGILLIAYLVISFFARKKGYADDECMEIFISFVFLAFFGTASMVALCQMIYHFLSHVL
jgi:hypothetical protein